MILGKNGPLDGRERAVLEQHPVVGEALLRPLEFFEPVLPIIRHHHEWFDGGGYPDRLDGSRIDFTARIVAVADAYDAMTSTRPYRTALDSSVALDRIVDGAGSQFDPVVVDAFMRFHVYRMIDR